MEVANMPKVVEKCVCCRCGESLPETQFYKSYSPFYQHGHLPICKDCFNQEVKLHLEDENYKSSKKAMQRMCMAFDIYFDETLFDKCDVNDDIYVVVGNYLKRLNMTQYKGKTFEDTLQKTDNILSGDRKPVKEKRVAVVDEYNNVQDDEEEINPDDIAKWGVGLNSTDYENLNAHYKYLTSANPHCDSNQEIFIIDLCYTKMQQLRCIRNGDMDNFKKMGEYYNSTFSKSGLKVASDVEANGDDCLGVWNARISQYTPEEYYKNKELYKDHDNFRDYIERFVLRPLRNLMHGTTDRDREFYVKDVGDEDEYIDPDTD